MRIKPSFLLDLFLLALPLIALFQFPVFYRQVSQQATLETIRKDAPKETIKRTIDKTAVVDQDLFRVKRIPKKTEPVPEVKPVETPVPIPVATVTETLPLELSGTIVDEDKSIAFIKNTRDGQSGIYGRNDEVLPGVRILDILLHKVILDNKGSRQELIEAGYNDALQSLLAGKMAGGVKPNQERPPVPVPQTGQYEISQEGNNVFVSQAEVRRQASNLSSLLAQVRVVPNIGRSGKAEGFKILHVARGSFVEAAGVRSGDIVRSVNGEMVDSIQKGYEIFGRIQNETNVSIVVERNGQTQQISYQMRN